MATSTVANAAAGAKRAVVNAFSTTNFNISGASGLYHRARPTYPDEAITSLLSNLPSDGDGGKVIELGAGTGLFTEAILRSPEASKRIKTLTAVEPSSGMREGFKNSSTISEYTSGSGNVDKKPLVEIVDGSFGDIPVKDSTVDLIVGAQCFHWAHPNYSSAAIEFSRVLKRGGTLALIWNLEDREAASWVAGIRDIYEKFESGTPQYRLGLWKAFFETSEYKNDFSPPQKLKFNISQPTTEQGVIDRVFSKSFITAQSKEEQDKIAQGLREVLREAKDKKWIDESQGVFEYPYETVLWLMKRK